MAERRAGWLRAMAVWGGVGLVVGCCVALGAAVVYSTLQPFSGLNGRVCGGFTTQPHLQAGVAWYSPISSYYPPLMGSPYVLCVDVPYWWISALPKISGEWAFPP